MSSQKTRKQYAFIEVEKSSDARKSENLRVSLSGPKEIVTSIYNSGIFETSIWSPSHVSSANLTFGNTSKLILSTKFPDYNSTFMTANLLEEILKHGFRAVTNITDDLVTLIREVDIQ